MPRSPAYYQTRTHGNILGALWSVHETPTRIGVCCLGSAGHSGCVVILATYARGNRGRVREWSQHIVATHNAQRRKGVVND